MKSILLILLVLATFTSFAQVLTREDSLTAGLIRSNNTTVISGYGQLKFEYDTRYKTATTNLTRNVLFIGHRFSNTIYFFSEMEIENAKVVGGKTSGEISMEQLFLKFNINRDMYLQAGLFIPRIGLINENHLPTTFNGNDRPYVETFLIPATWREIGIGLYGNVRSVAGLNYSLAVVNGLNSANFQNGSGIVEGKAEGSNASASNIAVTGALLYYSGNWRFQTSGYYGGSAGLTKRVADSLQLNSGPFGTPIALVEANAQYHTNGISFRALITAVNISDAYQINRAYANNTPSVMEGGYAEIAYNVFHLNDQLKNKSLTPFLRLEYMDMNKGLPSNGIRNGLNKKTFAVFGFTYRPAHGVVIKADYVIRKTDDRNPDLVVTPFPQTLPYYTTNGFFNLGIGYSF